MVYCNRYISNNDISLLVLEQELSDIEILNELSIQDKLINKIMEGIKFIKDTLKKIGSFIKEKIYKIFKIFLKKIFDIEKLIKKIKKEYKNESFIYENEYSREITIKYPDNTVLNKMIESMKIIDLITDIKEINDSNKSDEEKDKYIEENLSKRLDQDYDKFLSSIILEEKGILNANNCDRVINKVNKSNNLLKQSIKICSKNSNILDSSINKLEDEINEKERKIDNSSINKDNNEVDKLIKITNKDIENNKQIVKLLKNDISLLVKISNRIREIIMNNSRELTFIKGGNE